MCCSAAYSAACQSSTAWYVGVVATAQVGKQCPVAEARIALGFEGAVSLTDPDEFFVHGAAQRKAAVVCRHCPVVLVIQTNGIAAPAEWWSTPHRLHARQRCLPDT